MDPSLSAAVEAVVGYLQLGNEVLSEDQVSFVRNPTCPEVSDANHASLITAASEAEIDQVLVRADEVLAGVPHRSFKIGPGTPPSFEARLSLEGYGSSVDLEMILEGPLSADPPEVDIREVSDDADWEVLRRLKLADLQDGGLGRSRSGPLAEQMYLAKKAKAPNVTYFLARADGADCAFFSSWPGNNGIGVVEDLFTLPAFRRRGIATALIVHAVDHARAKGARSVLIGADPDDSPKRLFAALGFRPLMLFRGYWKKMAGAESA